MHDIDRALFESEEESELESYGEAESYEFPAGEAGETESYEAGESYEVAMAAELLGVASEAELDRFLGKLLSKAVSGARSFARSDAGRAVGGILKSAAKQALPGVGQTLGSAAGGALGRRAGQWLGGKLELGLETEGLSEEDREYETARAFVRFAHEAAQRTARVAATAPPAVAAQRAATAAAQHHLPGLLRPAATSPNGPNGNSAGRAKQGRWVRRGNRIVILDA
jgi:hypothetical protein